VNHEYDIHPVLGRLVAGETLPEDEADGLFEAILTGLLDEAQIGAALALVQSRAPTVDEITGAARAMRRHVTPVPVTPDPGDVLLDTCGTGGAAKHFNISTATAIVAAAAQPEPDRGVDRVLVAKHGNRSRSGRGSAEVLAGLGVNIDATPDVQARCLQEAGVCFCFAMRHHPAMRHAAAPRRSLGFPTIFNLLGPLTNPAGADRQLLGVYAPELVDLISRALERLGSARAAVVHGAGGLDECSTLGPTRLAWAGLDGETPETINPAELGLVPPTLDDLRARDLDHGVRIIGEILDGEPGPKSDIVALNAGVALRVADAAGSIAGGLERARDAIASGRARRVLEQLIACSRG
jgi:anthranilate phosphoribosyltransferase